VCGFFNGTNNDPLIKWIVDFMKASIKPGLIHPCPYSGDFEMLDMKTTPVDGYKWPDGIYKFKITFFDRKDSKILQLATEYETFHTGNGNIRF